MRRELWMVGCCVLLVFLFAGTAEATYNLHITGWLHRYDGVTIWANIGGGMHESGTYGAGAFTWQLNGQTQNSPLYCLDIYHTFNWGNQWNVQPFIVHPDPPYPPPYNTGEASWLFHKYGYTAVQYQTAGVQLALWETSHDKNWRTYWANTGGQWSASGDFQCSGTWDLRTRGYATTVLLDLYNNYRVQDAGHATYYQPIPYHENQYFYQGQLGEMRDSDVPEPSATVLLGLSLLAVSGVVWKKRPR